MCVFFSSNAQKNEFCCWAFVSVSRLVQAHCQQNQKESATAHANGYSIIDFVLSLSLSFCVFALIYVMCCVFFAVRSSSRLAQCTREFYKRIRWVYDFFCVDFLSLLPAVFDSKSNVNNHFALLFTLAGCWLLWVFDFASICFFGVYAFLACLVRLQMCFFALVVVCISLPNSMVRCHK